MSDGPGDLVLANRIVANEGIVDALALGVGPVALMRGHGSVVAGKRLADVVHTAYVLAQNARLQLQALALGEVYYLNAAEIENARATLLQPLSSERVWAWFVSRIPGTSSPQAPRAPFQ